MKTSVSGIQAVYANLDPKTVLAELQSAWHDFRARNENEVSEIRADLDKLQIQLARPSYGGDPSSGPTTQAHVAHAKAFDRWFRSGVDAGLAGLEAQAGLRTNSDPDGGYLVPDQLAKKIDRLATQSIAMRRLANIVTLENGDYKRPISKGGTGAGWIGETDERTETAAPALGMFEPPWVELYAMPEVTQKLLDLAGFDVAAWLLDEIGTAELELEGAAFISGNGVSKPKGILAYDTVANASWTYGKVGFITSGAAATLTDPDKLIDLQHALKPVYRQNGTWLMADSTWSVIRKLKDGEGNYLWRAGLEPGAPDVLLGKPVEIDDNMPAIGASAYPIAFGDFRRAYTIGDHSAGRRLIRDELTKKGSVKFYMSKRIFGGLSNTEAVKLLKISA